jgi:hypothetical protein
MPILRWPGGRAFKTFRRRSRQKRYEPWRFCAAHGRAARDKTATAETEPLRYVACSTRAHRDLPSRRSRMLRSHRLRMHPRKFPERAREPDIQPTASRNLRTAHVLLSLGRWMGGQPLRGRPSSPRLYDAARVYGELREVRLVALLLVPCQPRPDEPGPSVFHGQPVLFAAGRERMPATGRSRGRRPDERVRRVGPDLPRLQLAAMTCSQGQCIDPRSTLSLAS